MVKQGPWPVDPSDRRHFLQDATYMDGGQTVLTVPWCRLRDDIESGIGWFGEFVGIGDADFGNRLWEIGSVVSEETVGASTDRSGEVNGVRGSQPVGGT